jgi:cytochrome oxidase Cu insertion factor (SCO1/SenC/PrrC family)
VTRAPRGRRALGLAAALLALAAGGAAAHGPAAAPPAPDVFLQGAFTPAYEPPAPGTYELPAIRRVPAFALVDTDGRRVSTRDLVRGRAAVVSFIYTACSDRMGCPLASAALHDLQVRLREAGLEGQAVLLSISFDPERDRPRHLASYAQAYEADPAVWRFLTARSDREIQAVLDAYGQDRERVRDERGRFTGAYRHVLKVFLVDEGGWIRNVYSAGFLVPEVVVNDLRTVLAAPPRR